MGWFGYSFVDLTKEQVHARRVVLDQYALIAQVSSIVVLLAFQLYFLASWLNRKVRGHDEYEVTSSPILKAEIEDNRGSLVHQIKQKTASARWWLGNEVAPGWGTRSEYVGGAVWMLWLLVLCIKDTGEGMHFLYYLH